MVHAVATLLYPDRGQMVERDSAPLLTIGSRVSFGLDTTPLAGGGAAPGLAGCWFLDWRLLVHSSFIHCCRFCGCLGISFIFRNLSRTFLRNFLRFLEKKLFLPLLVPPLGGGAGLLPCQDLGRVHFSPGVQGEGEGGAHRDVEGEGHYGLIKSINNPSWLIQMQG